MMGLSFIAPILPGFVQSLGVGAHELGTAVGLTITAFGMARAVMNIPAGKLTKLYGRRLLLISAPAVVFVSAVGCGLTTAYWQLLVWRLLQGAAAAGYSVAALITLSEISDSDNRGLYISYFWTAALLGASIGPTFGGYMSEFFGYRFVFFCYAALALLSVIWGYLRIPETSARHHEPVSTGGVAARDMATKSTGYLFNPNFILISLVALFTLATIGGTQTTLVPLLGYEKLSLSEGQVGLGLTLIAVMQVLLSPLAGTLSDRLGRKRLIIPGGIITVLGLVMFVFSYNYWFFLFCALILGLGRGIGAPIPTAYVSDIALKDKYEETLATFRAISDMGWVIGPILCGYLKDTAGLILPFYITAGLLLLAVILFGVFGKESVNFTRVKQ